MWNDNPCFAVPESEVEDNMVLNCLGENGIEAKENERSATGSSYHKTNYIS